MPLATRAIFALIPLTVLLTSPLAAQDALPDSLDGAGFFPLAVGNEWQHDREGDFLLNYPQSVWVESWKIVSDTLVGDQMHFGLLRCDDRATRGVPECDPPAPIWYDTARATMMTRRAGGGDIPWGEVPCPLDLSLDLDECFPEQSVLVFEDASLVLDPDTLFGLTVRSYLTTSSNNDVAYGIGPIGIYVGSISPSYVSALRFVKVGETEVGTRGFAIPNSAERPADSSNFAVALGPNPTRGVLRLSVTAARPGSVRADAFDLLGRRVARVEAATAGLSALELDLSGRVPGLYLVRVTDGASTLTLRATVAQ